MKSLLKYNIESLFWIFLLIHLTLWTSAASLFRLNLPLDAIEGITWGQHLQWGYDKNPYISAWLSALAAYLTPQSGWMTYFICQLSVVICFWAVFQLSQKILTPLYGLLSILLLEGIQYYNFHAIDLSDNALELSCWALIILYFDKCMSVGKIKDWCLLGLFAGIGMMTKYYTALLLISLTIMVCIHFEVKYFIKKPAVYFALIIFLMVTLPHLYWLSQNNFATIYYTVERLSVPNPHWTQHLISPLQFTFEQGLILLPSLLLMSFLIIRNKKNPTLRLTTYHKYLLFYAGLGPYILTVMIALIGGIKLRSAWGQPLLSLWGVILLAWLKPEISRKRFIIFLGIFTSLLIITVTVYLYKQLNPNMASSAIFPGKILASKLEKEWEQQYGTALTYAAGPRWLAGNISFYAKNKPEIFMEWDPRLNTWLDENLLRQRGGIFIWDMNKNKNQINYETIKKRYQNLTAPTIRHFSYYRNPQLSKVKIMYAFLPPQ